MESHAPVMHAARVLLEVAGGENADRPAVDLRHTDIITGGEFAGQIAFGKSQSFAAGQRIIFQPGFRDQARERIYILVRQTAVGYCVFS